MSLRLVSQEEREPAWMQQAFQAFFASYEIEAVVPNPYDSGHYLREKRLAATIGHVAMNGAGESSGEALVRTAIKHFQILEQLGLRFPDAEFVVTDEAFSGAEAETLYANIGYTNGKGLPDDLKDVDPGQRRTLIDIWRGYCKWVIDNNEPAYLGDLILVPRQYTYGRREGDVDDGLCVHDLDPIMLPVRSDAWVGLQRRLDIADQQYA